MNLLIWIAGTVILLFRFMSKENFIQVFEYQKLKVGENGFKQSHFDSLMKFNEKNGNKYFTAIYNGILFNSYVGVIQVGGLTIEILPKADNSSNPSKLIWQKVLLNMLRICKYIQVDTVSETGLKRKHNSILEVYFEMFLYELEELTRKGLIKRYRKIENNHLALKGKLIFSKNIQKNLIHKEKFYCEYQVYDKNHTVHQILLKALLILDSLTTHTLKDRIKRLLYEFNDFENKEFKERDFENLKSDRKTQSYSRALKISKMLILNYSPKLNSGNNQMLTLLFDMNKLWEEYIYRVLQKHNDPSEYEITAQARKYFWEHKTIRPDIVIKKIENNKTFIIDTKWKIVDSGNPSDEDLKQMFVYNLHWKAEKSILLYPKVHLDDSNFGNFHHKPIHKGIETEFENSCKASFISILQDDMYKSTLSMSKEIIEKINA